MNTLERFEKKTVVYNNSYINLFNIFKKNNIKKKHPDRKVSSIYFDTHNFDLYNISKDGIKKRNKIRIRWYDDYIEKSLIEIKSKNNQITKKTRYKNDHDIAFNNLKNLKIKYEGLIYFPKIIISYFREYYLVNNLNITLDKNLTFKSINSLNQKKYKNNIIEVKFNRKDYTKALHIMKKFNMRQSRFSKYVIGIDTIYG